KQPLDHCVLPALSIRFPDQSVRKARVGCALDLLEGKSDIQSAAGFGHARIELAAARLAKLARAIELALDTLRRQGGIELEGTPTQADLVPGRQLAPCRLESTLANEAPGADDVGIDDDVHRCAHAPNSLRSAELTQVPSTTLAKLRPLPARSERREELSG